MIKIILLAIAMAFVGSLMDQKRQVTFLIKNLDKTKTIEVEMHVPLLHVTIPPGKITQAFVADSMANSGGITIRADGHSYIFPFNEATGYLDRGTWTIIVFSKGDTWRYTILGYIAETDGPITHITNLTKVP